MRNGSIIIQRALTPYTIYHQWDEQSLLSHITDKKEGASRGCEKNYESR